MTTLTAPIASRTTYVFGWVDVTYAPGKTARFGQPADSLLEWQPKAEEYVACYGEGSTYKIVSLFTCCLTCNGDGAVPSRKRGNYKMLKCPTCKGKDSRTDIIREEP